MQCDDRDVTGAGYSAIDYDDFLMTLFESLIYPERVHVVAESVDDTTTRVTQTPYFDRNILDDGYERAPHARFFVTGVDTVRVHDAVARYNDAQRRKQCMS